MDWRGEHFIRAPKRAASVEQPPKPAKPVKPKAEPKPRVNPVRKYVWVGDVKKSGR